MANADISFDGLNNPQEEQNNGIVLPSIAESVVGNTEPVAEDNGEVDNSEEVVPENNATVSDDLTTMYKTSNDPSKVILVTSVQYEKLKLSLDSKKALLHAKGIIDDGTGFEDQLVENGLLEGSVEDKQQQVQQLIAEAQELYKEGKSAEAQEKMNQVTALNEEIKNSSQELQAAA